MHGPKKIRYEMSLEEVGKELGISKDTVYGIERRALKKLRAQLYKRGIYGEDPYSRDVLEPHDTPIYPSSTD